MKKNNQEQKKRKTIARHYVEIFSVSVIIMLIFSVLLISKDWEKYKTDAINSEATILANSTAAYYSYLISIMLHSDTVTLKKYLTQIQIEEQVESVKFLKPGRQAGEFLRKCRSDSSVKKVAGYIPSCNFLEDSNLFIIQEIVSGSRTIGYLIKSQRLSFGSFLQYIFQQPSLLLWLMFIIIFGMYYMRELHRYVVGPLIFLSKKAKKLMLDDVKNYKLHEIHYLAHALADAHHELTAKSKLVAMGEVASQVAHDIRSPLAALDVACSVTQELPEEKRLLIRQAVSRIRDIANNLVHKSRGDRPVASTSAKDSAASHDKKEAEEFAICLLPSLVDELITEKRLQYRANMNIEILADLDKKSYGLFAKIQPVEFKRVLSNLVNNAVEAQGDKGQIVVSVGAKNFSPLPDDMIQIQIKDNGKGIPPEILPKLMERGASFGKEKEKESGSGLGLYHAKTTLQSWGGDLRIESKTNHGTTVTIFLKKEPEPAWFVPKLTLLPDIHLAILDDDVSIHQIWDGRLEEMRFAKERIHHFSTPSTLRKWFQQLKDTENMIYLFDYELIGQGQTGLDLIDELGIAKQSILVTSRYEEPDVLKQCQQQGVKLIPKPMAGFVPIMLDRHVPQYATRDDTKSSLRSAEGGEAIQDQQQKPNKPDSILIDDDESLRISWKLMAKALNKILKVYESVEAFLKEAAQFDKATPIYIDSDLGNGIKGEEVSKQLHEMGFTNIYLATGYNPKDFGNLPWIKGIVGKAPPWK